MTNDGLLVLKCLFDTIWRLFTSWYIPGTEVTPAGFLVFLAFAGVALRWLSRLFDIGLGLDAVTTRTAVNPVASPGNRPGSFTYRRD